MLIIISDSQNILFMPLESEYETDLSKTKSPVSKRVLSLKNGC